MRFVIAGVDQPIFHRAALVTTLLLVCYSVAFAETPYSVEHREWEVSGFSGASFSNNFKFSTRTIGSDQESSRTVGLSYDSGYQLGMRVNKNVHDHWGASLEYSFTKQQLHFSNLAPNIQNLSVSG